jgi:predicted deacetylase
MLVFLEQHHIQATFFCVAPVHAYYKNQPHFSEAKWVDRLNEIAKRGHSIEQHTHFYGSEGKKSDTSPENLCRRLAEDRQWLRSQGFTPVGFVGGGWTIGSEVFQFLLTHNYKYDCSARSPYHGTRH